LDEVAWASPWAFLGWLLPAEALADADLEQSEALLPMAAQLSPAAWRGFVLVSAAPSAFRLPAAASPV